MPEHSRRSLRDRLAPHPPKPPVASTSKAGRNLKAAIPTALGLLALVAASVAIKMEIFIGLVAIALCVGLWEAAGAFLARILSNNDGRLPWLHMIRYCWVKVIVLLVIQ